MQRTGKFIVIEGLDGSGKSTQLELLRTYLRQNDIPFRDIHFPRLQEGVFGKLVGEFLRGDFGGLKDVHPKLVSLLYAGDRHDFAPTLRHWLDEGYLVIADRYVNSNIAFQAAKCHTQQEKSELIDWILDLEYNYYRIPRPFASFFLDVSSANAASALSDDTNRGNRDYLAGSKDIHEADSDFQARVREEYVHLETRDQDFHRLICTHEDGSRLSPAETHSLVLSALKEFSVL